MVHFVGAGPGAPDLITVRGKQYLEEADVVIYAGSLVNPKLLEYTKDICTIYNSAKMTLEEVIHVIEKAEAEGKTTVRLHTGDPCIYGAIREQMDILDEKNIAYVRCTVEQRSLLHSWYWRQVPSLPVSTSYPVCRFSRS